MSTTESGITRRGNWVLRTTPSWATTEVTAFVRRFLEEGEEDDAEQQHDRVVSAPSLPMRKTLVKTKSRTPNSISGRISDQR